MDALCRISETVVTTSDLSTMMERVQEIKQVRFTMLEVSRYISGPSRSTVSGSELFFSYKGFPTTQMKLIVSTMPQSKNNQRTI